MKDLKIKDLKLKELKNKDLKIKNRKIRKWKMNLLVTSAWATVRELRKQSSFSGIKYRMTSHFPAASNIIIIVSISNTQVAIYHFVIMYCNVGNYTLFNFIPSVLYSVYVLIYCLNTTKGLRACKCKKCGACFRYFILICIRIVNMDKWTCAEQMFYWRKCIPYQM